VIRGAMTRCNRRETMARVVALVSGGIDSPVAACLVSRNMKIVPLHFCLHPFYCEASFELVMESLKLLRSKIVFDKVLIYPWGHVLSEILQQGARKYMCVLCRRGMFRAAELVCRSENASAIVTGESLGQKATQTLQNLTATSHDLSYPVLRPLIGFDKIEIQRLSRRLGIWSEKHAGCCTATQRKPATETRIEVLDGLYARINIQVLVEKGFAKRLEMQVTSLSDIDDLFLTSLKQMWAQTEDSRLRTDEFLPSPRRQSLPKGVMESYRECSVS